VISPEELEREIEDLVTDCGADLERRLRHGRLRLPEHLVGEVLNDALLVVADKRRRGHLIGNPASYLSAVARNAAIDRLRTLYASGIPDAAVTTDQLNGHGPANGHDMLAHAEISHDLRTAIKQLPRRQRQVIELRYLREFTVEETARILEVATGTVGPTTAAALRRLTEIMTEHNQDWEA
jgi:RNA polymerase sigma-70 factor (ECF subfamily)